jgi:hypothetical protein
LKGRALFALMNVCSVPDIRASHRRCVVRAAGRIDPRREAGLVAGADRNGIAVIADRSGKAEAVAGFPLRSFDVRLLAPRRATLAGEDVQRTGILRPVVVRWIDTAAGPILIERSGSQRVAIEAECDRKAEVVAGLVV